MLLLYYFVPAYSKQGLPGWTVPWTAHIADKTMKCSMCSFFASMSSVQTCTPLHFGGVELFVQALPVTTPPAAEDLILELLSFDQNQQSI